MTSASEFDGEAYNIGISMRYPLFTKRPEGYPYLAFCRYGSTKRRLSAPALVRLVLKDSHP